MSYQKDEELSSPVMTVSTYTLWLTHCMLIVLACEAGSLFPVKWSPSFCPFEKFFEAVISQPSPLGDLRDWQVWFIAQTCCQLKSRIYPPHNPPPPPVFH